MELKVLLFGLLFGVVAVVAGTTGKRATQHYEPQIACPPAPALGQASGYTIPSHLTTTGAWSPLPMQQLQCPSTGSKKKKLAALLRLCQKSYPGLDIVNILESSHTTKVLFCDGNGTSCAHRWVQPWRCLESPFQSEALLVPSPCLFDHVHNSSECRDSQQWNATALEACTRKGQSLKSFAVLLPCGVGMFTGVEFVCCPGPAVDKKLEDYDDDEDLDDDDDEEDDDDYDEEYDDKTTTTPAPPTVDPYYKKYDVQNEHENFLDAGERLEAVHKSRIGHVMEDWVRLEERYQKLRETDQKGAEEYKREVTGRFQKTVQSLEEESLAEKRQLIAVHQQRILSHLNERKREAMECFTRALNERPQTPHRIRKCVERLLRTLHKERRHALAHVTLAARQSTVERLGQLSNTARETMRMLERYPKLYKQLRPLIEDYVLGLQGSGDPVHGLLTATREDDVKEVDKVLGVTSTTTTTASTTTMAATPSTSTTEAPLENAGLVQDEEEDAAAPPAASLYEENEIGYSHASYSEHSAGEVEIRREVFKKENRVVYVTLAFAGLAVFGAIVVGLVVLRRGSGPRGQGFSEVSTTAPAGTPEEKHVANMQINGYENPTYRYFEQSPPAGVK